MKRYYRNISGNHIYLSLILILFAIGCPIYAQTSQGRFTADDAAACFEKVDASGNFSDIVSPEYLNNLPLGLKKTMGNTDVTLAVSSVIYHDSYAELSVFARVISFTGGVKKKLFFGAQGIKLSYQGNIFGDAKLVLLGDVNIPINNGNATLTFKGSLNTSTGQGSDLTYATIDCKGIREIGISAELEFAAGLLSGVDATGKSTNQPVKASFKTVVSDWNDIAAQISLQPFQINGLDGFVFECRNVIFDFSDKRNLAMSFPADYGQYLPQGNTNLWKGVYMHNLTVYLPPQFKSTSSTKDLALSSRSKFEASQMILDDNGITGKLIASVPILSFDNGDASGWNFSVDRFNIEFEANTLKSAGFGGSIGLPVSDTTKLAYDALIDANNNYSLTVSPVKNIGFDFLKAKATIFANSSVSLKVMNDKFIPEAMLNGQLIMAPFGGSAQTDKPDSENLCIEFQSMHLTTIAPYFEVEYFGYQGKPLLQNFPISISKIGVMSQNSELRLNMDVALNLSTSTVGISGNTSISVIGQLVTENNRRKWRYKEWQMSEIGVKASVAGIFSLDGHLLILKNDPVYGDGFAGSLNMKFDKVFSGFKIGVGAMFGQKAESKYWFCDAAVSGFSFPAGPMNITGFTGGVSMGMAKKAGTSKFSATGCLYVPEPAMGLGVKAGLSFDLKRPEVFLGEASFEVLFNKTGGVSFAGMYGAGKFMGATNATTDLKASSISQFNASVNAENTITNGDISKVEKLQEEKEKAALGTAEKVYKPSFNIKTGGIGASLSIQYDFTNTSFHSNLDTYVYLVGGILRGKNADNLAGSAVIHFDKNTWYAKIGTPKQPIGLKMGIGDMLSIEANSYFMIGNNIPNPEAPPKEVTDILGSSASDNNFISNPTDMSTGQGFAFGSRFRASTGNLRFPPLYVNLTAGLGYDVMLKRYAGAICAENNQQLGINGWYASGQAFGYFTGELGIDVRLPFFKAKVPIVQGGAAILMQAALPNPIWLNGQMGVKFRLLGGLVKGNIKYEVTLGRKCTIIKPESNEPPVSMQIISELSPKEEADVFSAPQVAFNTPIGQNFQIKVDDVTSTYRFRLGEFSLSVANGTKLNGDLKWNADMDKVSLYTSEVLPPNQTLNAHVSIYLEEYKNNTWTTVTKDGKKLEEVKEFSFKTGDAPQYIPITNVNYTYPVVDQKYFMPKESPKGFIVLKRGQAYLFKAGMLYQVNFVDENNTVKSAEITYNMTQQRIEYTLPDLDKSKAYSLTFTAQPRATSTSAAASTANNTDEDLKEGIVVRQNTADKITRTDVVKIFLEYTFKTSKYNTFKERITKINKKSPLFEDISSDVIGLQYSVQNMEPFDFVELTGTNYTSQCPLITAQSTGDDTYYKKDIYPYLYEKYNPQDINISNRDTKVYGIPPFKAVIASSYYLNAVKSGNDRVLSGFFPFAYYLPSYYKSDFINIRDQVVTHFTQTGSWNGYDILANYRFLFIREGNYPVYLKYVLPDGTESSKVTFEFKNL